MGIRTADAIRSELGDPLAAKGFELKGKWPRWSLERAVGGGMADKVECLSETGGGRSRSLRRMNVNFAVRHPRSGQDVWMNRPCEEWFEYGDEESLRRELKSCLSRIVSEVLPWMERTRSE